MAYSRTNFLTRIIEIQKITLEYKGKGSTQAWIYENLIYPNYFISMRTFNSYLGTNAKKLLNELERANNETKWNQPGRKKPRKNKKDKNSLKLKKIALFRY